MRLLLIRHGIAADKTEFAEKKIPDGERPLTDEGRKKMRRAARGLAKVVGEIQLLATSPLVRAKQTAELVVEAYGELKTSTWSELLPEVPPTEVLPRLRAVRGNGTVALVGHQPHLGRLASYLLTGAEKEVVELKKGGVCLLELKERREAGEAVMLASIPPMVLRVLGRAKE